MSRVTRTLIRRPSVARLMAARFSSRVSTVAGRTSSANLSGRARREPSHRGPGLLVKQPGKPGHPNAWSLVVLEQAKGRNHVVVHGRVPYADEPLYVGMG